NSSGATLLVDSGASETFFDDALIPGLKYGMREYKELKVPKTIVAAGKNTLQGIATGVVHCIVKHQHGDQLPVHLQGLIVPGLGRNIFSPTAHLGSALKFILEEG
ncbi:unnamed protein product, partial [Scytosiphon promiscuus]